MLVRTPLNTYCGEGLSSFASVSVPEFPAYPDFEEFVVDEIDGASVEVALAYNLFFHQHTGGILHGTGRSQVVLAYKSF